MDVPNLHAPESAPAATPGLVLGINASRARSGGARAHLLGILSEADPQAHGIHEVHVWSYDDLLEALPDRTWLVKHHTPALQKSLLRQVMWERFALPSALRRAGCTLLFNVDAGTVSRFRPAITMSQDMLSYEPGELQRLRLGKAWLRVLLLRGMQNASLRSAQGAIFLTKYAAKVIQQSCGELTNYALIPHGVGASFRSSATQKQWLVPGEHTIRCVYVSPVWFFKHQWVVVRAIARLRARGHAVVLTLVGGGETQAMARLEAELATSDPDRSFVKLLGHVPHGDLPALLAESHVFVFASSCENMPNTVLEAMAGALPIACSDRGPMPEVLADGGVYFNPEDETSIADAIEQLITNVALREGCAARAHELAEAYSWTRCGNETFDFAQRVWQRERANT